MKTFSNLATIITLAAVSLCSLSTPTPAAEKTRAEQIKELKEKIELKERQYAWEMALAQAWEEIARSHEAEGRYRDANEARKMASKYQNEAAMTEMELHFLYEDLKVLEDEEREANKGGKTPSELDLIWDEAMDYENHYGGAK